MRKFLLVGIVAVVTLGALFLATTLTGSDGVAQADGNGAIVINDNICGLADGDGNMITTDESHAVITPSKNGNTVLKCSIKKVANSTGKAVHYDADNNPLGPGEPCYTPGGATLHWKSTVSASGNATLTCLVP